MDANIQALYAKQLSTICQGGTGDGATATCVLAATGSIRSATVKAAGSGYSVDDVLTVATGTGGTFRVTSVNETGGVTGIVKTAGGTGYSSVDGAATTVAPDVGTGCTLVTVAQKAVGTITVGDGGSDYVTAIARFSGGGSSNDTWNDGASVTVANGAVTAITAPTGITYTSVPTITIIPGGPADATDLITAVKAYDTSLQNERCQAILEAALTTEVLTPEQAPIVVAAIAALIELQYNSVD